MPLTPSPSSLPARATPESWVLLDFVPRYLRDLEHHRVRPVEAYIAEFPGHGSAIRREYARLERERAAPPGESLGPYQLLRELGRGGQGVVYLAEDPQLKRQLAVKVINVPPASDPSLSVARLRREAQAAGSLQHPGLCTVFELGVEGHQVYLAMELIEGETLQRPKSPLSREGIREILRIVRDAARAVHAAHDKGFVHRDLKPSNIMIRKDCGSPVVLDFGVAHREDDSGAGGRLTVTGELVGTPSYLSPEQIAGGRIPPDRRSDVWALGVTLFELVCAQRPFAAATRAALYQAILAKEALGARRLNPQVSKDLSTCLEVALAKDPDNRYQSAEALADDLDRILSKRPIEARPPSLRQRLVSWARRKPRVAAGLLLAAVSVVAVVITVTWFWRQSENSLHRERIANQTAAERSEGLRELISSQVVGLEGHIFSGEIPLAARQKLASPMIKVIESAPLSTNIQRLALASAHYLSWNRGRPEPDDAHSPLLKAASLVVCVQGLKPGSEQEKHYIELGSAIAPQLIWAGLHDQAEQVLAPVLAAARQRAEREPSSAESQHLLALIVERAALLAGRQDHGEEEQQLFETLLPMKQKVLALAKSTRKRAEALREVGLISARISQSLLRNEENIKRALGLAREAVKVTEEAVRLTNTAIYWSDLHSADAHLARVLVKAEDLKAANFHFRRAIENLQISWLKSSRQPPRLRVMHQVAQERFEVLKSLGLSRDQAAMRVIVREDLQDAQEASGKSLMQRAAQLLHSRRQPMVNAQRARLLLRRVLEDRRENRPVATALLALATARSGFPHESLSIARRALQWKSQLTPQLEFELVRLFSGRGFAATP